MALLPELLAWVLNISGYLPPEYKGIKIIPDTGKCKNALVKVLARHELEQEEMLQNYINPGT